MQNDWDADSSPASRPAASNMAYAPESDDESSSDTAIVWRAAGFWPFFGGFIPVAIIVWAWFPYWTRREEPALLLLSALLVAVLIIGILLRTRDVELILKARALVLRRVVADTTIPLDTIRRVYSRGLRTWMVGALAIDCASPGGRRTCPGRKKTYTVNPSVPSAEVVRELEKRLPSHLFSPKILHLAHHPPPMRLYLVQAVLYLLLAGCWACLLWFAGSQGLRLWRVFLPLAIAVLVFNVAVTVVGAARHWHNHESRVTEFVRYIAQGTPALLVYFVIPFRSDLAFIAVSHLVIWITIASHLASAVDALRRLIPLPRPRWMSLAVAGWLVFPGQALLWEARHVDVIRIPEALDVGGAADERATADALCLADGRTALRLQTKNADAARLLIYDHTLTLETVARVPKGAFLFERGSWLWWMTGSGSTYTPLDKPEAAYTLPDIRLIPLLGNRAESNRFAYGYSKSADDGKRHIYRIDLAGRGTSHVLTIERPEDERFTIVEGNGGRLFWALQSDEMLRAWSWALDGDRTLIFEHRLGPGVGARTKAGVLALVDRVERTTRVYLLPTAQEWTIPIAVSEWEQWNLQLPYLGCYGIDNQPAQLFKLNSDGTVQPLPPVNQTVSWLQVIQSTKPLAAFAESDLFAPLRLVDVSSGRSRQLLTGGLFLFPTGQVYLWPTRVKTRGAFVSPMLVDPMPRVMIVHPD